MPYAIRLLSAACCLLLALIFSTPAEARRVALVIGNSDYKVGPLANPASDAAAVATALETQLKFDKVILKQNLAFIDFRDVLSQFSSEAMGADIALIYFAGHGIEASGMNYLIPVDAMLRRASDLNLQAIALQTVLEQLEGVRTLRLVILDACRDNPFPLPGAKRTVQRGLKRFEPEGNTLVLYAAKDGTTAEDGVGPHSPFTEALLKHIATPGLEVRVLVGRVRDEVMAATGSTQVPHHYGTLGGKEVYLRMDAPTSPAAEKLPAPQKKLPTAEKRPAPDVLAGLKLPPPPPPLVQKDKAPSPVPTPPPAVQKEKTPTPAPAPVVQKDKTPTAAPSSIARKHRTPSIPHGFAQIVEGVRRAVVSIVVTADQENASAPGADSASRPKQVQGSGFVISPDGYVVTNSDVVAGGGKVKIFFNQFERYEADIVGTDDRADLALLKIRTRTAKTFPTVRFAATAPRIGDWVVVLGNPFGLGGTVTAGIVSAQGRELGFVDCMQIDAAMNKGNSGGPSFNLQGEVVGVNIGVSVDTAFTIPAKTASDIIQQLKAHGRIRRGWFGVRLQDVDEEMAASLGLKEPKGALVAEVQTPSPAASAGIKQGDTILSVNGVEVDDSRDLLHRIADLRPDTVVGLRLMREKREQTVQVRLGLLPPPPPRATPKSPEARTPSGPAELSRLGLGVKVDRAVAKEGIVVAELDPASFVGQRLKVGDVILEADNRPLSSAEDLIAVIRAAIRQNRRAVLLLIRSGTETRFEPVPLLRP